MANEGKILDPVCDMIVDVVEQREQGLTIERPEREYAFCDAGCLERFAKDPKRYIPKVERWLYSGVRRPKRRILGAELAGEVAAVGATVSEFAVGDRVFGTSAGRFGAHAEFICMRERAAPAQKPAAMTFEEAAAVCDGAMLAL